MKIKKTKQAELIGNHPTLPNQFARWLICDDIDLTATKCHRSLTGVIPSTDSELIEWLARKLIHHHYSDYRLEKLKQNYHNIGFHEYAEQHRKLPIKDETQKGNATEVLLTEYVESCLNKRLIKVFKLKYNPNVDQSLKGDDTLMVDIISDGDNEKVKLYLGEAKFRKQPNKAAVDEISGSLNKSKKPLSYSFLVDELGRNPDTRELADILDKFIIEEIKRKGDLTYTGFLLSNSSAAQCVESHLDSDNPTLVFISVGIDNPEDLIKKSFERAQELIKHPDQL